MKIKIIYIMTIAVWTICFVSCDPGTHKKTSREDLDLLMRNQVQGLLHNGMSMFAAGGNSSAITGGGPMGFSFYPPWMYYGATVSSSGEGGTVPVYMDSSYYDASTGYWVYHYADSSFFWQWRYQFLPHDNEGYPTAETDRYLFDANYSGKYDDDLFCIKYNYSGQTDYQISGMKDWVDTLQAGTMVFIGTSQSNYHQDFPGDTGVTFSYNEVIDHVTMSEGDCGPRSGSMSFEIAQNATPDSFTYVYQFEENTSELTFEDFGYSGSTVFTNDGVRVIIDGEEYFYEVNCDSGIVAMGKTPKLSRRE